MQAIVYTQYGSPDVLQLQDVAKPVPQANEILVRIHATTVTPPDCAYRKADPFIIRFMNGFTRPKISILGGLLAGEIETIGSAVTQFKGGDQVFGSTSDQFGAHAEYISLPEDGVVTAKPANMSYEEAAGLPEALTPLYFLRELAHLQPGQTILINGASGSVGTYGVQLAKYFGAEVTGVCSTKNLDLVRSLGADHVIDYTQEDFTLHGETYDVIFDAVGKSSFAKAAHALKPNGLYLMTVPTPAIALQMLWTSQFGRKKAILGFAGLNQKKEDLILVKELAEAGQLKSVIDRRYTLDKIADAHRYVEQGHKVGNVVITLVHPATNASA